ncbi:hypothetical protein ACJMK2_044739, partial [Sinanodonta woodiana]
MGIQICLDPIQVTKSVPSFQKLIPPDMNGTDDVHDIPKLKPCTGRTVSFTK